MYHACAQFPPSVNYFCWMTLIFPPPWRKINCSVVSYTLTYMCEKVHSFLVIFPSSSQWRHTIWGMIILSWKWLLQGELCVRNAKHTAHLLFHSWVIQSVQERAKFQSTKPKASQPGLSGGQKDLWWIPLSAYRMSTPSWVTTKNRPSFLLPFLFSVTEIEIVIVRGTMRLPWLHKEKAERFLKPPQKFSLGRCIAARSHDMQQLCLNNEQPKQAWPFLKGSHSFRMNKRCFTAQANQGTILGQKRIAGHLQLQCAPQQIRIKRGKTTIWNASTASARDSHQNQLQFCTRWKWYQIAKK